jgi:hypothetical protein
VSRDPSAAKKKNPATDPKRSPGSLLPRRYSPLVAGYSRGPFITPAQVTPTDWRWRGTRTYIVVDNTPERTEYRCLRVHAEGRFIGYWAVELLGELLPLPEWKDND